MSQVEKPSMSKSMLTSPRTKNMFYKTQKLFGNPNETVLDSVDIGSHIMVDYRRMYDD